MAVGPLAEQGAADADDRGALLDRDLEVVGHAHRQVGADGRAAATEALGRRAERDERRPGILRAIDQPANRHQAAELQVLQLRHAVNDTDEVVGRDAGLRRVGVDVDLEQDGNAPPGQHLAGQAIQPLREGERIHGLDDGEGLEGPPRFVRLERTHEVPRRALDERGLRLGFLDAVLAERRQARGDGGPDALDVNGLGDRDEGDLSRIAPDPGAGGGDPLEDRLTRRPELIDGYLRRRNEGISRSSAS
jgi:hypothetical protein